jgi:hypothetical protein
MAAVVEDSSTEEDDEEMAALFAAERAQGRSGPHRQAQAADQTAATATARPPVAPVLTMDDLLEWAGPSFPAEAPALGAEPQREAAPEAGGGGGGGNWSTENHSEEDGDEEEEKVLGAGEVEGEEEEEDVLVDGVRYLLQPSSRAVLDEDGEQVGEWAGGAVDWQDEECERRHLAHPDYAYRFYSLTQTPSARCCAPAAAAHAVESTRRAAAQLPGMISLDDSLPVGLQLPAAPGRLGARRAGRFSCRRRSGGR